MTHDIHLLCNALYPFGVIQINLSKSQSLMTLFLRLLEKEKAALVEEKEQLVRASQELLGQVDNQLPFDPNDPKVKELEEWECSVSRSVIVEVGLDIRLIISSVRI